MYQGKKFIGVIPARGGSKKLPRKNILTFAGRPLLVHSFERIRSSNYLDEIVVSTEDAEIKSIAEHAGINVIDRPKALAEDTSPTEEALLDAIDQLRKLGKEFDYVVTLEPTSPLRTAEVVDKAIEQIVDGAFDSLATCTAYDKKLGRNVQGEFKELFPGQPDRRQDREKLYEINSMIFITKIDSLLKEKKCMAGRVAILETSEYESIDINTASDFKLAEYIYSSGLK